jgi:uncharacterized protein (TIGR03545 family)
MRKKFVFFLLIPLLVFLLVVYLFLDSWVESGLEYAGERIAEAKVEIDGLHVSVMPLGIEFHHLQVANRRDPWTNVFETGLVKFAMDFGQLLRGKFIIETMEINDLLLGTARTTDGSLPPPPPPSSAPPGTLTGLAQEVESDVGTRLKESPIFDLGRLRQQLNIDSLLNVRNLRTVQHIDSITHLTSSVKSQWTQGVAELEQAKGQIVEIEKRLRAIKPNELKTVESITGAVATVNDATTAISTITETFNARRAALTSDMQTLSSALGSVDAVVQQDYEMLRSFARIPSISMAGMATLVMGKKMYAEVLEYLSWIEFLRQKIPVVQSKPDFETPPRLRGQDIRFPVEHGYPKLWIKKMVLSGGTDSTQHADYYYVKGVIQNITNNQRITRVPLTADLVATRGGSQTIELGALFDRTTDIPRDAYRASARGFVVRSVPLGRVDFLPSTITEASTALAVDVQVPGSDLTASADIGFRNITIAFERDARTVVERLVRDVLSSIREFTTTLRLWKRDGRLDVALHTDLDDRLVEETKRVVGAEIARLQTELKTKLEQRVAAKRAEVERLVSERLAEARQEVAVLENLVNENRTLAESKKKELERRIEEEKQKQTEEAKKKLEDAVKGLFKKK